MKLWYPAAVQRYGPLDKQGYPGMAVNECRGVVCHSMVGTFAGAMGELDKPTRRASWAFSVLQSGEVAQHYPLNAVTWHCGSAQWNGRLIGIEHEGGYNPYDEPLTTAQRDASVALVRWLSAECGFPMERKVALWEHNEVAPPSDATSCPSHRIPWDYYTAEDDEMTERVWNSDLLQTWVVGKNGAAPVLYPAMDEPFKAIYGAHTKAMTNAQLEAIRTKG